MTVLSDLGFLQKTQLYMVCKMGMNIAIFAYLLFRKEYVLKQISNFGRCTDQVKLLKIRIKDNSCVSDRCLGGDMKPVFEKVRNRQLELVQKILQKMDF